MWLFNQDYRKEHNKEMGLHRKLKVSEWMDVSLEQSTDRICDYKGAII